MQSEDITPKPRSGSLSPAPAPQPPEMAVTGRAVIWEVVAVLCVGVGPYFAGSLAELAEGPPVRLPAYWVDSLQLTLRSACTSFAVLYLMARSGQTWRYFGIPTPGILDVGLGILLCMTADFLRGFVWWLMPQDIPQASAYFPMPRGAGDYLLMGVKHAANGFAEELVCRAYLITRLERLLWSPGLAVLVSALLFTSYHLYYGPGTALVFICLLGLVYGGVFLLLRRIWPLAIGHMLFNVLLEVTW